LSKLSFQRVSLAFLLSQLEANLTEDGRFFLGLGLGVSERGNGLFDLFGCPLCVAFAFWLGLCFGLFRLFLDVVNGFVAVLWTDTHV
jgi:hypothetical protein